MRTRQPHPLVHSDVVAAIRRTLRKFRVRPQDLADGIAEVQTRALEYLRSKPEPADVSEWRALCVTIARNWRLKEIEKQKTAAKWGHTGLCEDPAEHIPLAACHDPRDQVDTDRLIRVLAEEFRAGRMPQLGEDILDCAAAGMTQSESAEELGIPVDTLRVRLRTMRRRYAARLKTLGIAVGGGDRKNAPDESHEASGDSHEPSD
jgi:DNA-directed RNA polymerase specialized sigma24 family protein